MWQSLLYERSRKESSVYVGLDDFFLISVTSFTLAGDKVSVATKQV